MAQNPLQNYFRQPKVFLRLPSMGIYNKPEAIQGNVESIPVYGMTGMDEIILKTPDALISGESTVKVLQSCCPAIVDAWDVSNLDIDALLVAVRIATYGNTMNVSYVCKKCSTESEYDIDLGKILEHFYNCTYDSRVVVGDLEVKLRPLTYKEVTGFNLENFALQKRLSQAVEFDDQEEKQKMIAEIFKELGLLQNKIFIAGVDEVITPDSVVNEHAYIKEWLENADRTLFDALKNHINKNNDVWRIPENQIKCDNCGTEDSFTVELDQANFFANA
jgi:hypothetical protein